MHIAQLHPNPSTRSETSCSQTDGQTTLHNVLGGGNKETEQNVGMLTSDGCFIVVPLRAEKLLQCGL